MDPILQRLKRLSDDQRRLLARWLDHRQSPADRRTQDLSGRQQLVGYVVANSGDDPTALDRAKLQTYLRNELPEFMVPDAFVELDQWPRLPNGKVDKSKLPDPMSSRVDGDVPATGPVNHTEQVLIDIWSELLGLEVVRRDDNFFEVGGDSIVSIQVISRAREAGLQIEPKHIVEHPTIAALAQIATSTDAPRKEEEPPTGDVLLTPIQAWFLSLELNAPHHWNQASLWAIDDQVDPEVFEHALIDCLEHHDALRIRLHQKHGRFEQWIPVDVELGDYLTTVDLRGLGESEQNERRQIAIGHAQSGLQFQGDPLFRVVWFKQRPAQPDHLLVVAHHLIIDQFSWPLVWTDLHAAYQQRQDGDDVNLPDKTTAYRRWAQAAANLADSESVTKEREFWLRLPPNGSEQLPMDFNLQDPPTEGSARRYSLQWDSDKTDLLMTTSNQAYNTRIGDLLLTALTMTVGQWTGRSHLTLGLEGHGRDTEIDRIDLSRTVGWCTSFYPATLQLAAPDDLEASIKSIKEQLRAIPRGGITYGALRYLSSDNHIRRRLSDAPSPQLLFNYLGQIDAYRHQHWFRPLPLPISTGRDPTNRMTHILEINAAIRDRCFVVDWTYSDQLHRPSTIETLAAEFLNALSRIVEHCASTAGGFTPSDFPEAELSQQELDQLFDEL